MKKAIIIIALLIVSLAVLGVACYFAIDIIIRIIEMIPNL